MVFIDPPYNIAYEGGSKKREAIENDDMVDFYGFLQKVYTNCNKAMRAGASIYVCHADTERINFTKAFIDSGFYFSSVIIWVKSHATFGRQNYFWKHEPILYGWKEGEAHKWYGDNNEVTVWNVDSPSRSVEHPTMKPVALVERAIRNSSKRDEVIMDLFGGSGTSLIAAHQVNRIAWVMEFDPKYVDVIIKRYEKLTGEKAVKI